jgi:hypothetical protein
MYLLHSVFVDLRGDMPVLDVGFGSHHSQVGVEASRALALVAQAVFEQVTVIEPTGKSKNRG